MEGLDRRTVALALVLGGLVVMAAGGLVYAISLWYGDYGLVGVGVGAVGVVGGVFVARKELAALLKRRSARLGIGAGVSVVAAVAIVVFVGAIAARHSVRWDFSKGKRHTLAPQTLRVLRNLKKPVKAYAFFRENQAGRAEAKDLLDLYALASRNFSYQFIDPDRDPALARKFEVRNYGTVVLVCDGREEHVSLPEEGPLTNAILKLTRPGAKTIYFLTGHGEPSLDDIGRTGYSRLRKAIEQQNYKTKTLLLATAKGVPQDAAAVVCISPKKPFTKAELERLDAYLARGGGLLLLLDPDRDGGLKQWLKSKGVLLKENLVLDKASTLFGMNPAVPVVVSYGYHEITRPLEGMITYFPIARVVELAVKLPEGEKGVSLIRTSRGSWAESDPEALVKGSATYDKDTDRRGPISLGVALSIPGKKPKGAGKDVPRPTGHLVVIGDSDFANNNNLEQAGNRDLILNAVSYLAREKELVSIRPKPKENQPILLQPYEARIIFWVPVVVLPALVLVAGVVVIMRRRRPA